jgi:hypothetical protein
MTTIPQKDTKQSLFYSAINALRIAGQEKIADDLDQRMEDLIMNDNEPYDAFGVNTKNSFNTPPQK